jgi:hypothetical protein
MRMTFTRFIVLLCVVQLFVIALYMGQLFMSYSNASLLSQSKVASQGLNSLHITQTSAHGYSTSDVSDVRDVQSVQQFHDFLYTLPQQDALRCANDNDGQAYHFQFYQGSTLAQEVTATVTDCTGVDLGNGDVRQVTDDFWSQLSNSTGHPLSTLQTNYYWMRQDSGTHHCHQSMGN